MGKVRSLSKIYKLDSTKLDFVDIDINDGLPLYVDPLLFWKSPHKEHHAVHAYLVKFFITAIEFIRCGQQEIAKRMCHFPEPENLIGMSSKGHGGRGISSDLGDKVFNELLTNVDIQRHGLTHLNEFQFMIEGISHDLISDMTTNIAKRYFVHYTNVQCEMLRIPTEKTTTLMFCFEENEWDYRSVELPIHPETNEGFILTPKMVVRRFVGMGWKDFYKDFLREVLKQRIVEEMDWQAIGKKPKVTWGDVKE